MNVWNKIEQLADEWNTGEPIYMYVTDDQIFERLFETLKDGLWEQFYPDGIQDDEMCEGKLSDLFAESDPDSYEDFTGLVWKVYFDIYKSIDEDKAHAEHQRDVRTQAAEMGYHNYANGAYFPSDDHGRYY